MSHPKHPHRKKYEGKVMLSGFPALAVVALLCFLACSVCRER